MVATTLLPKPPKLTARPVLAPSTWRPSASPRSCRTSSTTWDTPVAPRGWPFAFNPSGGLKAKGHPLGATGVSQVVELVRQLRGEADGRQVEGAKTGLAVNFGGFGNNVVATIVTTD